MHLREPGWEAGEIAWGLKAYNVLAEDPEFVCQQTHMWLKIAYCSRSRDPVFSTRTCRQLHIPAPYTDTHIHTHTYTHIHTQVKNKIDIEEAWVDCIRPGLGRVNSFGP